jgi:hypothetical protein
MFEHTYKPQSGFGVIELTGFRVLRDTWLECCGHLSCFSTKCPVISNFVAWQEGNEKKNTQEYVPFGMESQPPPVILDRFKVGDKINYTYPANCKAHCSLF